MTEDAPLPPPPVPSDADLKNFPFTPIYRARLFGSAFHAKATDAEWRAGVTLWLKSQDQCPAGSLPEDDTELCRLAELGRDLKSWRKVKIGALHGWYPCADGRLYHATVAETVREQWTGKVAQRQRTLKARIAAAEKRLEQCTDASAQADIKEQLVALRHELSQSHSAAVADHVTGSVTDHVTATNRKGKGEREGKGEGYNSARASRGDGQNVIPLSPASRRKGDAANDAGAPADEFPAWYQVYPRHVARPAAEKAYRAARKEASAETLMQGAQAMRRAVEGGRDIKFVPYPATWLNQKRWLDDDADHGSDGEAVRDPFAGAL